MSTVQLAIHNPRYAAVLADLLQRDGSHNVAFVDHPDLGVDGVIVVDAGRPENLALFEAKPERFVVITRKDAGQLARIWDAGVRHVVFEEDSPSTALLAVIAAELRNPHPQNGRSVAVLAGSKSHKRLLPPFPVPILMPTAERRSCPFSNFGALGAREKR